MALVVKTIVIRLAQALLLILAVIVFNFLLIHLAPGDPQTAIAGAAGGLSQEQLDQITDEYNLDEPVLVQLGEYVGQFAQGDLGTSYFLNEPVLSLIGPKLGATALLAGTGLLIGVVLGTALGIYSAWRRDGISSSVVSTLAMVGFSAPAFWTGIMLVLAFAIWIPIFPTSGMESIITPEGWWAQKVDVMQHLALPSLTLGFIYAALYARTGRASMLEVLGSDYIRTAWSKGLGTGPVLLRHALRNALLPLITLAGLQVGALLSSAILVEVVFDWPGVGQLALDSILRRDTPVLLGILLMSSVLVIVANLVTDLLYRVVDPRISMGAMKS